MSENNNQEPKPGEHYLRIYKGKKEMMLNNFLGGISWALGAVFGAGIILAIIGFIISKINFIPIIGNLVINVAEFVKANQTSFK